MTEIIQTLKAATDGLAQPFEVFYHVNPMQHGLTISEFLTWTGHNLETPVQIQEISGLFSKLSTFPDPDKNTPEQTTQQLARLRTVLERELTNIHVFYISQGGGETYIIGKDQEGNFAGLKTTLSA